MRFSGDALETQRRARGWTQERLAREASLATVTVSKLEEGRIEDPRTSTLIRLAVALGCDMTALVTEREHASP